MMDRGSERKVPHIGTATRSKLLREAAVMVGRLNQPSSVQDDGPMGCKLLLCGNNVAFVNASACTVRIRIG